MTRAELIRLGQSGRPWSFLPLCVQAVTAHPEDDTLRFLLAANFARVGLVGPARDQLDRLDPRSSAEPGVVQLRQAISQLPEDRIPPELRIETCRRNVERLALRTKGVDLEDAFDRWVTAADRESWHRALDGNIARCRADGSGWIGLGDQIGAARQFVTQHIASAREQHRPLTIEGVDPPWLVREIHGATRPDPTGYAPRLAIIQADLLELLDGLAHADLRELIDDPRVTFFVGDSASDDLAASMQERIEYQIVGPFVPLLAVRRKADPPVPDILRHVEADQLKVLDELAQKVGALYAGRDRAWWRRRYAGALDGSGPPLRVLVPTTRYSTYIQHSARGLVDAFRHAGCEAELMIEPDASSKFSALAYLRLFERFEPDLVVLINYTRHDMGPVFPKEIPFICWMQDAMSHHYSVETGRAQGELDFLVGHVSGDLFERFEYPRARALRMPVVVNTRAFHPGPVSRADGRRFECEIAWVSHHSETPEAMHRRLRGEIDPSLASVLDRLEPIITTIAADAMGVSPWVRIRQAVRDVLAETFAGEVDESLVVQIFNLYARPLGDRIHRHETLAWAAELAERRGWRLKIFGRGWDEHPTLGRFAAGEVAHGEPLRCCYQKAAVHLHMTLNNIVHQRVMECALSGGVPICRMNAEALSIVRTAWQLAASRCEQVGTETVNGRELLLYSFTEDPEAMMLARQLQVAGDTIGHYCKTKADRLENARARGDWYEHRPDWLLADLGETTFHTRDGLEAIVERAIDRPRWRRSMSDWIASRVRARLTDDVLAGRMIGLVRGSLDKAGP